MLLSMTGFGTAQGQCEGVEYTVEVRSVNNRYFKASLKLPDLWTPAEADIEKLLRERLNRGSVTLSVRMRIRNEKAAYTINSSVLERYLQQLQVVEWGGEGNLRIDLSSLLQLPGVCEQPPLDDLCESTREELMGLIEHAVSGLETMRKHEGKAVEDDLLSQCKFIETVLEGVAVRSPEVVKQYHQRLVERVEDLVRSAKVNIDQEHLARETAIFADRCDINEEISRLRGHLDQFRKVCHSGGSVGRKLDFIAQEMLREVNTIGSKANDSDIARGVVEMKTAVDRIKEQVQNVM